MVYNNPKVDSSYKENNLGKTLYDYVLLNKPKKIIEFGTLNGYSAISMAMALHELRSGGKIICYDLWDRYQYKHSSIENTKKNIDSYGLLDYIELKELDFNDWKVEDFDLLHLDISNDGNTIIDLINKCGKLNINQSIIFEGGTIERDRVEWMDKYNKKPITSIRNVGISYNILNENFPSISQISHSDIDFSNFILRKL